PPIAVGQGQCAIAAMAGVPELSRILARAAASAFLKALYLLSRAVARIDEAACRELRDCVAVDGIAIALAPVAPARAERVGRTHLGPVAEPVEIVEDPGFICGPAPFPIVILDAKQHLRAGSPHVLGIQHMPEVEPSRRRRRKPGQHGLSVAGSWKPESGTI